MFFKQPGFKRNQLDRILKSDSAPYVGHEDSFVFLMNSVAQLEDEIATGRRVLKKCINPVLFQNMNQFF